MTWPFKRTVLVAALAVCLCSAAADEDADVHFTRDISYGKVGDEQLLLNLARPRSDAKDLPCVVFIHGGGWSGGHRGRFDDSIRAMARRGYVAATVSYRFAPKHPFPAHFTS